MGKKVCMLLSYLPFLDSRVFELEAKSLVKNGYEVTIIAPRKNRYLYDIDGTPFTKQFRDKIFQFEGIKVVTYENNSKSINPKAHPLFRLGVKEKADIYHIHELSSLYFGKEVKRALKSRNVKLIYDSRQITPDPFSYTSKDRERRQWKRILLEGIKEADAIITVSDSIKAWYLSIDPLLNVEAIYNTPYPTANDSLKAGNSNSFVVGHEGNLTDRNLQNIYAITDSCSKVIDFQCKLIGGPRYGEKISVPDHLQNRIIQAGWVPYSSLSSHMSDVDVGLIDLDASNSLNHAFAMPFKLFSYLNNGIPVVVGMCNDIERLINTYHCGIVINRLNPSYADYVKAIVYLYQNPVRLKEMKKNAKKAVKEIYNWGYMENRLINLYQSLESNQTSYLLS
ncbi:Glycosyltransferase involved in cell wall bisynthesis [Salinibacillus kushneri]|uniref:Glycosyltransferase involved in cell wall bisynthesis n=1 Tax=Salinibacillus kushneri TaxID=237682 RepID=A0A1I0AIC2_9BACI|nr:glycosyltransferase [Salinibacillus kushneri]SES93426.1 Glycosyltransferase involved in cell wall bisynthesis [Salinibacillus kushneri]